MNDHQALWQRLKEENLVEKDNPSAPVSSTYLPIRIMQGFAGWIAMIFLFGFIGTILDWSFNDNEILFIMLGGIGNIIAFFIFRNNTNSDFIQQSGFVINLCAQLLVSWGIWELNNNSDAFNFFTLFLYQSLLALIIPNFTSRFLSTWFAMLLLFAGLAESGIYFLNTTLVSILFVTIWIKDEQWGKRSNLWSPIAYGLAFSLIQFNGFFIFGEEIYSFFRNYPSHWITPYTVWIRDIVIAALLIYLSQYIRQQLKIQLNSRLGIAITASSAALIILGHFITGLSGALLLLIMGLIKQNRLLISFGITAFIGFVSWYYYLLSMTLLNKSILLLVFGVCFGIAYFILNKLSSTQKESTHKTSTTRQSAWLLLAPLLIILVLVNANIYQKEGILKNGQLILLRLAPIDPRSLMQGDYMRLRFEIENSLLKTSEEDKYNTFDRYAVVTLNKNQVASFSHLYEGKELEENQVKIQFKLRYNRIRLSTHAFFFEEGTAKIYEPAKYGEFRVAEDGVLLLNNLRDKDFKVLGYNSP
ncbi:MAG: GDYXXLXY domain-containing protein [Gammaproteobacteria bacterium]|nr:GDYXXLXY domain-containing protein [Gammaproteobacteria bacterium]